MLTVAAFILALSSPASAHAPALAKLVDRFQQYASVGLLMGVAIWIILVKKRRRHKSVFGSDLLPLIFVALLVSIALGLFVVELIVLMISLFFGLL